MYGNKSLSTIQETKQKTSVIYVGNFFSGYYIIITAKKPPNKHDTKGNREGQKSMFPNVRKNNCRPNQQDT